MCSVDYGARQSLYRVLTKMPKMCGMRSFWRVRELCRVVTLAMALVVLLNAIAMHPPLLQDGGGQTVDLTHSHGERTANDNGPVGHDELHEYHAHGTIVSGSCPTAGCERARPPLTIHKLPEGRQTSFKRPPRLTRS